MYVHTMSWIIPLKDIHRRLKSELRAVAQLVLVLTDKGWYMKRVIIGLSQCLREALSCREWQDVSSFALFSPNGNEFVPLAHLLAMSMGCYDTYSSKRLHRATVGTKHQAANTGRSRYAHFLERSCVSTASGVLES
jgi:hypothetical protein